MHKGELILYTTEDGISQLTLRELGGQVWLTQLEIAELYQTSKQNISKHVKAVLSDGELAEAAVVNSKFTTASDGKEYLTQLYALPMIIAVGYRVRSTRGTQFRQWATRTLAEYLSKGFIMDDERLKDPKWDYFDELLERIRDIRASEKRFYQKVRDLFALSSDYHLNEQETQLFFAEVQNKLLYAVTEKTAADLIISRADSTKPNMALMSWSGAKVRKQDVIIAKNYLTHDEVETLNRLVTIFLEQAELRVKDRKVLTMDYWRNNVDRLLEFNDKPILVGAGSISTKDMQAIIKERYENYNKQRSKLDALQADANDLQELEALEKALAKKST